MAGAYSEEELSRLAVLGKRRTAKARMDICQRHLSEFTEGGNTGPAGMSGIHAGGSRDPTAEPQG
jgi:hypothetical protein